MVHIWSAKYGKMHLDNKLSNIKLKVDLFVVVCCILGNVGFVDYSPLFSITACAGHLINLNFTALKQTQDTTSCSVRLGINKGEARGM